MLVRDVAAVARGTEERAFRFAPAQAQGDEAFQLQHVLRAVCTTTQVRPIAYRDGDDRYPECDRRTAMTGLMICFARPFKFQDAPAVAVLLRLLDDLTREEMPMERAFLFKTPAGDSR